MTVPASSVLALAPDERRLQQIADTVLQQCDALARCTQQKGSILRTFLSPAMEQCNQLVSTWMTAAGMQVCRDTAGNLHGFLTAQPGLPTLLLVSHLDTVPNAGRYDGVLGVILAVALVQAAGKVQLPFNIEVIGFSDEEGVRYGLPFIGSRALTGTLASSHLPLLDADNISLDSALRVFRIHHPDVIPACLSTTAAACLEFHIEQGPVLEEADVPLAVVDSIAGQCRATIIFHGHAGHAGTTPMSMRRDALTAAAEWLLSVESIATATSSIVATTGRILCEPNASNIIPGSVECTLDVRSSDDLLRAQTLDTMLASSRSIATRRRLKTNHTLDFAQPSVALDPSLTAMVTSCLDHSRRLSHAIVSGAGHDSMILAPHVPSAMIFLRSPGGISHHPDESVRRDDVIEALRCGLRFFEKFPGWLHAQGDRKQAASCTI